MLGSVGYGVIVCFFQGVHRALVPLSSGLIFGRGMHVVRGILALRSSDRDWDVFAGASDGYRGGNGEGLGRHV